MLDQILVVSSFCILLQKDTSNGAKRDLGMLLLGLVADLFSVRGLANKIRSSWPLLWLSVAIARGLGRRQINSLEELARNACARKC